MYFPIQCFWYLIHFWLPLWQVTVLAGVRWQRKGKIQGYRSSPISEEGSEPWVWSGWESWGRTERGVFRENEGGQSSCWVTQETHPGEIMRRKHTDVKGRAPLYNRGWSKIEKTFPRTKDCLPSPPPPSSRTPSLLPGTYGISLHLLSFHSFTPTSVLIGTHVCCFFQSLDYEPLQVKDWLSINAWWMNEQGRTGTEFFLCL